MKLNTINNLGISGVEVNLTVHELITLQHQLNKVITRNGSSRETLESIINHDEDSNSGDTMRVDKSEMKKLTKFILNLTSVVGMPASIEEDLFGDGNSIIYAHNGKEQERAIDCNFN